MPHTRVNSVLATNPAPETENASPMNPCCGVTTKFALGSGSVNAPAVAPVKGSGATPAISVGAVKLIRVEAVSAA